MKNIENITYCLRMRNSLSAAPEDSVMLYSESHLSCFMYELAEFLSHLNSQNLVEILCFDYGNEGIISEVFFNGEEISVDDSGTYFKIDDDTQYVLADSPNGIVWVLDEEVGI